MACPERFDFHYNPLGKLGLHQGQFDFQRKESNAWLDAIPSKHIGTFVDENFLIGLRLGSTIGSQHVCLTSSLMILVSMALADRKVLNVTSLRIKRKYLPITPSTLEPPGMLTNDGKRVVI